MNQQCTARFQLPRRRERGEGVAGVSDREDDWWGAGYRGHEDDGGDGNAGGTAGGFGGKGVCEGGEQGGEFVGSGVCEGWVLRWGGGGDWVKGGGLRVRGAGGWRGGVC